MLRRRTMSTGKRETVQVVEELKSSGKWTVPAGCKSVDVFIVGGVALVHRQALKEVVVGAVPVALNYI